MRERRHEGGLRLSRGARPNPPLVSIVTVVFHAKEELQKLLENLSSFDRDQFEWIVIDGGFEDGTMELLSRSDDTIDYWLSEPDSGIYDAMNKGIAAAHGEYILHLNEGDRLRMLPLATLSECLAAGIDVAAFSVFVRNEMRIFRPKTGFWLRINNTWHHQGTFYRRTRLPGYDPRYRVFGDFELNQRILKAGYTVRLFEAIVAEKAIEGLSSNKRWHAEMYGSIRRNFGVPYIALAFLFFKWRGIRYRAARVLARMLIRCRA